MPQNVTNQSVIRASLEKENFNQPQESSKRSTELMMEPSPRKTTSWTSCLCQPFHCSTKGCLYTSAGKSADSKMYSGGALFIDRASKAVLVNMQIGMTMHKTLQSKLEFENWLQDHHAVALSYLTNNASCFTNDEYTNELIKFGMDQAIC